MRAASTFSYRLSPPSTSGAYDLHWSNPQHPHRFHKSAQEALNALQSIYRSRMTINEEDDVLIYPVIQAGQFELREEVETVTTLFQNLSVSTWASWMYNTPGPVVDLTSGYFGLSDTYRRLVIESDVDCRIIAASPQVRFLILYPASMLNHGLCRQMDFTARVVYPAEYPMAIPYLSKASCVLLPRQSAHGILQLRRVLSYASGREMSGHITQRVRIRFLTLLMTDSFMYYLRRYLALPNTVRRSNLHSYWFNKSGRTFRRT